MTAPFSTARVEAYTRVFTELDAFPSPVIFEVGRTRDSFGMEGDGYSTIHFTQYLNRRAAGTLVSTDACADTEKVCRAILEQIKESEERILFINVTSERFIVPPVTMHLLSLDGPDCNEDGTGDASAKWHLKCFEFLADKIVPGGLVLVDDCFDANVPKGKGVLCVPEMIKRGYEPLVKSYAWLLRKPI